MFSFFSLVILSRGFFSLRGFFFLFFFLSRYKREKEEKKKEKEMILNNSIMYFTYVYNLPLQLVSRERKKKKEYCL